MTKNLKELKALNKKYKISVRIVKNMPDLSNDPVVLAKMEKAEKLIAQYGIPEEFKAKNKKPVEKAKVPKAKAKLAKRNA
jgi:hypothetical protein